MPETNESDPYSYEAISEKDPKVIEAIQKVKGKEIEIEELFEVPAYFTVLKFSGLVNKANKLIILAKLELNLQDPAIPKSQFERPITSNSLRYVSNYLLSIDEFLIEARALIQDPSAIKPGNYNSEWQTTD